MPDVVYGTDEKRGFIKLTLVSFAFTLGGVVFLMVALGSIVVLPVALHFLGLDSLAKTVLGLARWPLLFLVVAGFLAVIFRWGPCRALAKWRWVTPGGLVATLLWILVSAAFSWYVSSFGNYNKTYGSLGAVIGFMTWMWLSLSVILTVPCSTASLSARPSRHDRDGGRVTFRHGADASSRRSRSRFTMRSNASAAA